MTDPRHEEVGTFNVHLTEAGRTDPLFANFPESFPASLVHHDSVLEMAPGFVELAFSERCRYQAMRLADKPVYGTQFHGEMTLEQLRDRLTMYQENYIENDEAAEQVVDALRHTEKAYGVLKRFLELYT